MTDQPNRLGIEPANRLSGTAIDRTQPVRFRLDGRAINGFAGDTVLSAALASGLVSAGTHLGSPLALDEAFAPHLALRSAPAHARQVLPMARTPALDGLDLVSIDGQQIRAMKQTPSPAPWVDSPPTETLVADLLVVGGGVAGLSAAVSAGQKGDTVILLERRPFLGGDMRYFGSIEDEDSPDAMIAGLLDRLTPLRNVRLLAATEAFALLDHTILAHRVESDGRSVNSRVLAVSSRRIVLATGSVERLPVFAGNRLPGVAPSVSAFHLAERYGVWTGRSVVIATSTSEPYRLAVLAQDAGLEVKRVVDCRLQPQSRFVEYCKACGIPQAPGLLPSEAALAKGEGASLALRFASTLEESGSGPGVMHAERLIVCGCWQPDLSLWHLAGGGSRWDESTARLLADDELDGIALAGSVAGLDSTWAAMRSGQAAAARLFGRTAPRVEDKIIDPAHETPSAPATVAPTAPRHAAPAYLDRGSSLAVRPAPAAPMRWRPGSSVRRSSSGIWHAPASPSIGDIAAAVQLGTLAQDEATTFARERSIAGAGLPSPALGKAPSLTSGSSPALPYPRFLGGRFGAEEVVLCLLPPDGRQFEPGALVYTDSSGSDPLQAVGVVLGSARGNRPGASALMAGSMAKSGRSVWVKSSGQMVRAEIRPAG